MQQKSKSSLSKIYLDHSATTPVDPRVVEAMLPFLTRIYGNPSSVHTAGREARSELEKARSAIAKLINARESEIYFVSGGTEADNLALQGVAYKNRDHGHHIITTAVEHQAVLNSCKSLEKKGFEITSLKVDQYGQVSPETVCKAIRKSTILISIIHGNNEMGTLNPIAGIGKIAREAGVYFHSDAVQTFGKIPFDVQQLNLDLMSLSGHKIYAPKGIGVLYIRQGTPVEPLIFGGQHENSKRAGTENLAGIAGLAKAAEIMHQNMDTYRQRIQSLRDYLQDQLLHRVDRVLINGHPENRLYNILNVSFPGCDSEALLMSLDMKGISVSTGSACTSGSLAVSHVLKAMGIPAKAAKSAIRISLGKDNTKEEIDYLLQVLEEIIPRLRKM